MDLYYPPRPKSKLEEYNLKLKERELYTNNILDRFTQNGNGAPIRDEKGNLVTKRKAVLENIKHIDDDISQNQQYRNNNINEINEENNNNNDEYEQYEDNKVNYEQEDIDINNENNLLENTLEQRQLIHPIQSQNINYRNPYNLINNEQSTPEPKETIKKINNKSVEINEEDYQGIGIIPRVSDFQKIKSKMKLDSIQDDLARAIEEKRLRAEKEKQRQRELDLKEDLKVKKAIEEEQRLLKLEKKKKEEEENRLRLVNLQNIEKNKKKKKLIDIDEYYGKDFRLFQKNKNNIDKNPIDENEPNDLINNNYTSNINNEYEVTTNMNNINNMNNLQEIKKTKNDTLKAINNFTINVYKNRQILENDIRRLKKEVRNQYLEMNDLFQKLKDSSSDADYTKNALLQKSQLLKDQLLKSKIENTLTKNIINQTYEENMNVNTEDLELKNINTNPNLISHNSNLPGTSDFLYFNEEDNTDYDMSALAKAGKNIIELKGEGEMIPFNEDNKEKEELKDDAYRYNMDYEEYLRNKQFYEDMHKECKMEDLYKDLEDIENINKKLTPMNKIQTLKSNFNADYERLLTKEKKIKERLKNKF